jgi:transcriptional regulator with XRE-family HTH domain
VKTDLAELRKRTGLIQAEFWRRVGVTQSGGSRYENGRPLSKSVRTLLVLAYGDIEQRQQIIEQLSGCSRRGRSREDVLDSAEIIDSIDHR